MTTPALTIDRHRGCRAPPRDSCAGESGIHVVPDPAVKLPPNAEIVSIGTVEAEDRFLEFYRETSAAIGQ
jgi:hypothetical protein